MINANEIAIRRRDVCNALIKRGFPVKWVSKDAVNAVGSNFVFEYSDEVGKAVSEILNEYGIPTDDPNLKRKEAKRKPSNRGGYSKNTKVVTPPDEKETA